MSFYYSLLGYFKEEVPRFFNVTNKPKLAIELEDNGYPITDSKNKKARKMLERAAKKKGWHNNLYTPVQKTFAIYFVTFLESGLSVLTLSYYFYVSAFLSCFESLTSSLSCFSMPALLSLSMSVLLSCFLIPTLSSCFTRLALLFFFIPI